MRLPLIIENAAARRLVRLPEPVVRALDRRASRANTDADLCPRVGLVISLFERLKYRPPASLTADAARLHFDRTIGQLTSPDKPMRAIEDLVIPGHADGPDIPARLYVPTTAGQNPPLIVQLHGGGGVIGSIETGDHGCRDLAHRTGAAVLSPDYRLAPEHPFPAATDDALQSYRFAVERAAELGVDPARIAVGGDSMGGNLACAVCLRAPSAGLPSPAALLLIYPWVSLADVGPSVDQLGRGYILTTELLEWFTGHYLQSAADAHNPLVSPLLSDELSLLPPTLTFTAGFDPLRDQGRALSDKLERAGVRTGYRCFRDQIHGFLALTALPSARAAADEIGDATRQLLASL